MITPPQIERRPIGTTDAKVSLLGMGCAAIGNLYAPVTDAAARQTLTAAWDGGVRYFDTAPYYGHGLSEQRLGDFLASRQERAIISTKVGRSLEPVEPGTEPDCGFASPLPNRPYFDYTAEAVQRQVEASRARLGVEIFDMLLVHDIGAATHGPEHPGILKTALNEALPALNQLKAEGSTRAIGLGVNEIEVCLEVLEHADIDVILLAGRYTLLEQSALDALLPLCAARSVSLVIGGPYNSGLLAGGEHYDYGAVPSEIAQRLSRLQTVCREHEVPLPAAALQFPLAHPAVASVIPGARSAAEVNLNLGYLAHPIPAALWDSLRAQRLIDERAPTPRAPAAS